MASNIENDQENRTALTHRIGELAHALPHCALPQLVRGVDDIRCFARDHGFAGVETLASHLESAIAAGGYRAAVLSYLDAMSDAAADRPGPMPVAMQEAWLASVAVRLGC